MGESSNSGSMDIDNTTLTTFLQEMSKQQASIATLLSNLTVDKVKSSKSAVARPEPFKSGANDARRFIHYFTLWARSQGPPLNKNGQEDEKQWITSALSLLQGEAATWAVPYLRAIEQHTLDPSNEFPCGGNWTTFVNEFKLRFEGSDDALQAQRELARITQGKHTVAEYSARFQEVAGRTGFSDTDLMSRYREGLNKEARKWLALFTLTQKPKTLSELVKRANECDFEMRGVEDNRRPAAPTADPYAMDIDATKVQAGPSGRSRNDFLEAMRGKCFGCGSTGHNKKNGNHGNIRCNYCKRMGHLERVCQDRFMGYGPNRGLQTRGNQRAAATTAGPAFTLFPEDTAASIAATPSTLDNSLLANFSQLHSSMEETNKLLNLLAKQQDF